MLLNRRERRMGECALRGVIAPFQVRAVFLFAAAPVLDDLPGAVLLPFGGQWRAAADFTRKYGDVADHMPILFDTGLPGQCAPWLRIPIQEAESPPIAGAGHRLTPSPRQRSVSMLVLR